MSIEQQLIKEEKDRRKGKRYFFNQVVMICNHVFAIALLVSYLSPHVSPENFWFIAFFGLAYPLLLVINILFVIYWAGQLKKRAAYSLIIIIAGWSQIASYAQITLNKTPERTKKTIKVMSYNVKIFDLYNWTHDIGTRSKMFGLINDESPDIFCFQEFFSRDSSKLDNLDSIIKFQKAKFVHVEYTTTIKKIHHWGIATFSSYPIIKKGRIDFGYKSNNICIYTDIKVGADTLRIYNMHLQSISFHADDYKYVEELQKNLEKEDVEHSKSIFKRLKLAFIKRSQQADLIEESIASSPYSVIVCGDFNDTPASYAYHTISRNLNDAFIESGNGFGRSYVGAFPSFRIDYILHSKTFTAYNFRTIHEELSDHYPVCCYLVKNE